MTISTLGIDQGVRGFIYNTARENLWRVASFYELDDLAQEGFTMWVRVVRRYPDVTSQRARMSLFKAAFVNHIHNMARNDSRRVELVNEASLDEGAFERLCERPDDSADPDVGFIIAQLPQAIVSVLKSMIDGTEPRRSNATESANDYFCRVAGLPPATNFQQYVLSYLRGA